MSKQSNTKKTNRDEIVSLINDLKTKTAKTSKDKYEILELRDRILKLGDFAFQKANIPNRVKTKVFY